MNQEKIGNFISTLRKKKKLTQECLAEKLGVSINAVSKWERGICLMDMSLLKPLSEILGVTVNDILSGEIVDKENINEKFEENIINTIDYANKKISQKNRIIAFISLSLGVFLTYSAMVTYSSESYLNVVISLIGVFIFITGIFQFLNRKKFLNVFILNIFIIIISIGVLFFIDFLNVKYNNIAPKLSKHVIIEESIVLYITPFYSVSKCSYDPDEKLQIVSFNQENTFNDFKDYCSRFEKGENR